MVSCSQISYLCEEFNEHILKEFFYFCSVKEKKQNPK